MKGSDRAPLRLVALTGSEMGPMADEHLVADDELLTPVIPIPAGQPGGAGALMTSAWQPGTRKDASMRIEAESRQRPNLTEIVGSFVGTSTNCRRRCSASPT